MCLPLRQMPTGIDGAPHCKTTTIGGLKMRVASQ